MFHSLLIKSLVLCFFIVTPVGEEKFHELTDIEAPVQQAHSFHELVHAADIIAYGSFGEVTRREDTTQLVEGRRIIHYIQPFYGQTYIKGGAFEFVDVLTTGVEPSPPLADPLNKRFPGAVAEGEYVVFLKKIPGRPLYYLIGGWQGLYPVYEDEIIVLEEGGFQELGGLTVEQLKKKVELLEK
ncbi:conserved hypothetical protein [[Clostridium] ultunense Esp]|uniref:hypothetical protein n=1 Tax=Thermicanus aegyptius TaxID=94009 RepID=UPI0002B6EF04|nr:hypothetical protein [Thermicanus aegyptius]CCQ94540.1 conserved hypothetical protein [[Clostridium] ultunense Esp]